MLKGLGGLLKKKKMRRKPKSCGSPRITGHNGILGPPAKTASIGIWTVGKRGMELATGIEPATCGLQITWWGVAHSLVNMGNPLSLPA